MATTYEYVSGGTLYRKTTLNANNHVVIEDSSGTVVALAEILAKYKVGSATGVTIGVSGSPASILKVGATVDHNLDFRKATVTPSGLGTGESVTYHVIFYFSDSTSKELTTKSGVTTATDILFTDIDWNSIPDGVKVTDIEITAESSASSTSATSDATISGLEL